MHDQSPVPATLTPDELDLLAMIAAVVDPVVYRPAQGQDNTVAIAAGRWVIRIAKTRDGRSNHANELALLRLLPESCRAPRPLAARDHGIVYEYIPGEQLGRDAWLALDPTARSSVAHQLHSLLQQLHSLPNDLLPDSLDMLDAVWVRSSIRTCSAIVPRHPLVFDPAKLLVRFEDAWLLGNPPMAIVHVDLKPSNLLLDGDQAAIIDFGGLSLGDPAIDYGVLTHHLGENLLREMGIDDTALAARARCYADLYALRRCTRGWTRSAARP